MRKKSKNKIADELGVILKNIDEDILVIGNRSTHVVILLGNITSVKNKKAVAAILDFSGVSVKDISTTITYDTKLNIKDISSVIDLSI